MDSATNTRDNQLIQTLSRIVLDNLANEQFGVRELASTYGASRSQLHKKLKKSVGKSVSQFIREIRLQEAMKLLQEDAATVSEIAYQVGFHSPAYFNTCFKDFYGYPPGEAKVRAHLSSESHANTSPKSAVGQNTTAKRKKRKFAVLVGVGVIILGLVGFFMVGGNWVVKQDSSTLITNTENKQGTYEKTIAVLPLKNWSGDPELEYISDGMTDAIITKLAKIESIKRVVPFTSMVAYKHTVKSIQEIAEELGVQNILQGSFQLAGDQVNVKLQLIDGSSEQQFWESEYQRNWKSDEIFELQYEVAENVAKNIDVQISDSEQQALTLIPTSNKEAYDLYLQGNYEWSKGTKLGYDNAKRLYNEAIKQDSAFIDAYVNLSLVWIRGAGVWANNDDQVEAMAKAKKYLLKAKRLAPNSDKIMDPLLRISLFWERDFETMEENYHQTLVAPLYLMYVGKYKEAEAYMKNANNLKRSNESLYSYWSAETLFYNNKQKAALEIYKKDYIIFNDDYNWLRESIKYLYYLGEYQLARERLDRFLQIFPDRPPIVIWFDAVISHSLGDQARAIEQFEKLNEIEKNTVLGSPAWFIALYYCHIKEYDNAFRWLNKSYKKPEAELIWLHSEPLLRPVRNDPRYLKLHKAMGFPSPPLEPETFPQV